MTDVVQKMDPLTAFQYGIATGIVSSYLLGSEGLIGTAVLGGIYYYYDELKLQINVLKLKYLEAPKAHPQSDNEVFDD